jgi:hypothetical protein
MQDPREFQAWLETQDPQRHYDDSCSHCPLATWMREAKGALRPTVSSRDYVADYSSFPLPVWAQRFVGSWDSMLRPYQRDTMSALELIKDINGITRRAP